MAPATGDVGQLSPDAAERSISPPRLMSPRPTKSRGNSSRAVENLEQDVDILWRGDASEQHDVTVGSDIGGKCSGALFERPAISRVRRIDVDAGEALQRVPVTIVSSRTQPGGRRDGEDARLAEGASAAPVARQRRERM